MNIRRVIRHVLYTDWQARNAFPPGTLQAIGLAIHASEKMHGGEVRFAVEGGLDGILSCRGHSARERAIAVFSELRVWDTERNNGVLIYVLLADRAVEIVADRGIHVRVGDDGWRDICQQMESAFSQSKYQDGAIHGIGLVAAAIGRHFPALQKRVNELPDQPVMLT